ncbi:MAG TPA: aminotransferase class III-fold pyridoxal phosphate-dependent enzyme, partial [Rhodothermales bacterium]|nr:aminotransferase class III-fold pyridoxal phosphate-dependent enzyme [Rhodothermales bacterium]
MQEQATDVPTHTNGATSIAEEVRAGQKAFLWPCVASFYKEPLVVVEASGMEVVDAEGRCYLDFFAGILTTGIGHCHPEVVRRVQEQVARLGHTSTLYQTENQVRVAERLAGIAPGPLRQTFFTNSGSEAVETA